MEKFASSLLTDQKCNPNQMVVLLLRLDVVTKPLQEQGIGFLFISIYMVRVAVLSNLWLWPRKGHHVLLHRSSRVELSVKVFIFLKIIDLSPTTVYIHHFTSLFYNCQLWNSIRFQIWLKYPYLFIHFGEYSTGTQSITEKNGGSQFWQSVPSLTLLAGPIRNDLVDLPHCSFFLDGNPTL